MYNTLFHKRMIFCHQWALLNALPVTNMINPTKPSHTKIIQHQRHMRLTVESFIAPGKTIWKKSSQCPKNKSNAINVMVV